MRIGVTGADGFLGWHMRAHLKTLSSEEVLCARRKTFLDDELLDAFVDGCDAIVHAAGVNRSADDSEIRDVNIALATKLAESIARTGSAPVVVFANSTHSDGDSVFGKAKAEAAKILGDVCASSGGAFVDVILPHLFGEYGRPFYNSGVHTFAHQIVTGETPEILHDGEVNLLHAQQAARLITGHLRDTSSSQLRPEGVRMRASEALARLRHLAGPYLERGDIPEVDERIDLELFNVLRSNMYPDRYPIPLTVHGDARGGFFEVLRANGQGQTSISTTVPGITRGEHYHLDKIERFVVVSGEATISMRQLFTDTVTTYRVNGAEPVAIDMPPLTTHNIVNVGEGELVTLFWSNDHFDPDNPDTYPEPVAPPTAGV